LREEYVSFFKSNEENWLDTKNKVEDYIKEYGKLPSRTHKNTEIKTENFTSKYSYLIK